MPTSKANYTVSRAEHYTVYLALIISLITVFLLGMLLTNVLFGTGLDYFSSISESSRISAVRAERAEIPGARRERSGGGRNDVIDLSNDTVNCAGVEVIPGDNIQLLVNSNPNGTIFCIKAGVHRLATPNQNIRPGVGQSFIGEPGAIISGAKIVENFEQIAFTPQARWIARDQTEVSESTYDDGPCDTRLVNADGTPYDRCKIKEWVFYDNKPLWHVASLEEVHPGTFFIDRGRNEVYIADDPEGHLVELSVARAAFWGSQKGPVQDWHDVTIRGLIIEKFAGGSSHGAIDTQNSSRWIIEDNEVRFNHGGGIKVGGDRSTTTGNFIHHNGQIGIIATKADHLIVDNNEIAFNNIAGFSDGWEGGGTKFVRTGWLEARNNYVHNNHGPGLWTDIWNHHVLYAGNTVVNNANSGIEHEIGYSATIRDNYVRRNGGAGIFIFNSKNTEIYNNTVGIHPDGTIYLLNAHRNYASADEWPLEVHNVYVHNNTVALGAGYTGLVQTVGDDSYFTDHDNRFENNTYYVRWLEDYHEPFKWLNQDWDTVGWKANGQDLTGIFHECRNYPDICYDDPPSPQPATPTGVRKIGESSNTFSLAWDPSTEENVWRYFVHYRIKGSDDSYIVYPARNPFFNVTDLEEDTEYEFKIMARNTLGNKSLLSEPVYREITGGGRPSPPEIRDFE